MTLEAFLVKLRRTRSGFTTCVSTELNARFYQTFVLMVILTIYLVSKLIRHCYVLEILVKAAASSSYLVLVFSIDYDISSSKKECN